MENEQTCKIAFLDVSITHFNNCFHTAVRRKPTFSGQGLSFFSNCTFRFKVNSIKTLLHRAFNISSSYLSFHDELLSLKNYFHDNGYPKTLIDNIINKFLNAKYDPPSDVEFVTRPKLFLNYPFMVISRKKWNTTFYLSLINISTNTILILFYPIIFRSVPCSDTKTSWTKAWRLAQCINGIALTVGFIILVPLLWIYACVLPHDLWCWR